MTPSNLQSVHLIAMSMAVNLCVLLFVYTFSRQKNIHFLTGRDRQTQMGKQASCMGIGNAIRL